MLTADERELIVNALSLRKNIIETGTHTHSAIEAERFQKENVKFSALRADGPKVRALSVDQMKLIVKIDELMNKIIQM